MTERMTEQPDFFSQLFRLYIYDKDGYDKIWTSNSEGLATGGKWFRRGPMPQFPEVITAREAQILAEEAIKDKLEVRVTDSGDQFVYHSVNGKVLHGQGFWLGFIWHPKGAEKPNPEKVYWITSFAWLDGWKRLG